MLAYSSLLLSLTLGCDDKGSDSAGAESDADTDTDTDTDTDADPERYLEGTIHVTVTDATGKKTLCDTMVDITGEEFSGQCLQCDFTLDIATTVASEKGTDCDYSAYPGAHLMEDAFWDDVYLGWSDSFDGPIRSYEDLLWVGYNATSLGRPGPYWTNVIAYADGAWGTTSYKNGIGWTRAYDVYGYNGTLTYCGYPAFTHGSPNYGGAYTGTGSLNCSSYVTPYENWTFQSVDNGYAYISIDTVSKDTAFDPVLFVSASDSCWVGYGDESFACTFPPPGGLCPSLKLPTEKGETYTVAVRPSDFNPCEVATGDYEILVATKGDPSLKQVAAGELTPYLGHVTAEGDTTITLK